MYSHSSKKRASDRKKTQEELQVFEKLSVDSGDEKEEETPFDSNSENSNHSDINNSESSKWKVGQSFNDTNNKIE